MAETSQPAGEKRVDWRTKTKPITVSVRAGDTHMVTELQEFYGPGTSASEVYRTAIRTLYTYTIGKRNA